MPSTEELRKDYAEHGQGRERNRKQTPRSKTTGEDRCQDQSRYQGQDRLQVEGKAHRR